MKLAVAVSHLGPSQLAYTLIKNLNELSNKHYGIVALYENVVPPCFDMKFPRQQIFDGYGFKGDIIATSLTTAYKLLAFPTLGRKFFYCWDLEWLRIPNKKYADLYNIYGNKEFTLIARNEEHKKIISDCWNVNVQYTIEDCNYKQIEQIICSQEKSYTENLK